MILYVYIVLGIAAGIIVPLAAHMVAGVHDIWKILLFIIAFVLGLVLLHLLVVVVGGLFINKRKELASLKNMFRTAALATLSVFLAVIGANLKVSGMEKLPKTPFMMVCNHRSLLDAVAAVWVFRDQMLTFISKKENAKIPVIGGYMVKLGCLFLDRDDNRAAIATINKAADLIKSGKASVAVCPEGTRNRTKELLLPFHAGSFKIAQKAKCSLVVASVWGTDELKKHPVFKRTTLFVDIIDVLPPERVAQMRSNELADYSREIMHANLERYI